MTEPSPDLPALTSAAASTDRHGSYNGWCYVTGIPLHARDCPACESHGPCFHCGEPARARHLLCWSCKPSQ
jgi:hypothetical protein